MRLKNFFLINTLAPLESCFPLQSELTTFCSVHPVPPPKHITSSVWELDYNRGESPPARVSGDVARPPPPPTLLPAPESLLLGPSEKRAHVTETWAGFPPPSQPPSQRAATKHLDLAPTRKVLGDLARSLPPAPSACLRPRGGLSGDFMSPRHPEAGTPRSWAPSP